MWSLTMKRRRWGSYFYKKGKRVPRCIVCARSSGTRQGKSTLMGEAVGEAVGEGVKQEEDNGQDECVICLEWDADTCPTRLHPCGHAQFCFACATKVRTCPLCRSPIDEIRAPDGTVAVPPPPPEAPNRGGGNFFDPMDPFYQEEEEPGLIVASERKSLYCLALFVWFFIFVAAREEWEYNIPRACDKLCKACDVGEGGQSCHTCLDGFINGGLKVRKRGIRGRGEGQEKRALSESRREAKRSHLALWYICNVDVCMLPIGSDKPFCVLTFDHLLLHL